MQNEKVVLFGNHEKEGLFGSQPFRKKRLFLDGDHSVAPTNPFLQPFFGFANTPLTIYLSVFIWY